jgi:hypothetical protein
LPLTAPAQRRVPSLQELEFLPEGQLDLFLRFGYIKETSDPPSDPVTRKALAL